MVSYNLPRSMVTNQIALNQSDLHSTPEFERAVNGRCQALVYLRYHYCYLTELKKHLNRRAFNKMRHNTSFWIKDLLGYVNTVVCLTKGACEVNFCRTFISSISLFLELAGSNLAQTLLIPLIVVGIGYIRKVCLQVPKMAALRTESIPCNHSINAVLTGFNSNRQRILAKFEAKIVNL